MIKIMDLIRLARVDLGTFKIHCATGSNPTPLEAFLDGMFKQWQEYQNQKNFQCDHILSLIHLGNSRWLFAGVYRVDGVTLRTKGKKSWYQYRTTEIDGLGHLTGRAIIHFEKNFRASYLRGPKFTDQLVVAAICDRRMSIGDFPGYNSIRLSFRLLKTVIQENNPSWRAALSSVAGVYLVTDTTSGQLYVGSAYGGKGIWQRWAVYTKNGHGGNAELRELLQLKGSDHAAAFQFSILEVCDLNASDDHVIARETHWKNVLCSRTFGLNKN